ncbi:hypothetical protein [Amycolatopsis saalfeldensis]|uniref:Subtilisin inhibitor-like n=1 Tax=Amycolatopsis saalfeldensis TaxID=394193 RepID=A0A1H8YHE8_9PSEU|nr:hypothetical protein [Amycolatopsis saalfeldensis]SEP51620.1 hypothetical protein SAMN04489732_116162 [Amycolatopsis saalfeldensis]
MRTMVARSLISGSLLGVALTLTACGGGGTAAGQLSWNASSTPAAPTATSSAPVAAPSSVQAVPDAKTPPPQARAPQRQGSTAGKRQDGSGPAPRGGLGKTVDCGQIDGPTGKIDVVAEAMPAGTVGCTEAIDVLSDYLAQAPTKAEGTAHVLTVDGWQCAYDGGTAGSGLIGCGGKGLSFHGQP